MLWTICVILIVLWLLGIVTSYTMGGLIHKADIKAQGMARRDYGFYAIPDRALGRQTCRCDCLRI